ncbi:PIR Superfamily Protein [Plasmodium ovale wallikeri]|uniref:PIR Superfamily Protein n=1 Tax=Plasmodium ovale wallikeri TaxID=864142 RepID=A0A1A8ZJ67_PLAOA|nr:PIR Superfamily Protein [Plasmodium ovale wallikeri]SBT44448.1 PIR Superfamily Protein [Plasmodium ovale wallikeri]
MAAEESKLPSCIIYAKFSQEDAESSNSNNECNLLQERLMSYTGIDKLCRTFEKIINDLCIKERSDDFLSFRIGYLYYWLMDQAIKTFKITNNASFGGIKSQFYNTWNNIINKLSEKHLECKPLERTNKVLDMNEFKDMKEIYNYYYNYKYMEKKKTSDDNECRTFCKYLSSMNTKFPELKSSCTKLSMKCLIDKESFEKCDPQKLRKILNCNENDLCIKMSDQEYSYRSAGGVISPGQSRTSDAIFSEPATSVTSPETSNSALTIGLPLFGILAICFISFKLTPIRSWFYNKLIKKGKITDHMVEEENNALLDEYFLSDNIKPHEKGYRVAYNSLQNIE